MHKQRRNERRTIRKLGYTPEKCLMCLYGRRVPIRFIKAYCNFHKCYLSVENIKEKSCNKKKCKNLKEIIANDQPN